MARYVFDPFKPGGPCNLSTCGLSVCRGHPESDYGGDVYIIASYGLIKVGLTGTGRANERKKTLCKQANRMGYGRPMRVLSAHCFALRSLARLVEKRAHEVLKDFSTDEPGLPCPTEWYEVDKAHAFDVVGCVAADILQSFERPPWMKSDADLLTRVWLDEWLMDQPD